jgi:hypothetical protein
MKRKDSIQAVNTRLRGLEEFLYKAAKDVDLLFKIKDQQLKILNI